MQRRELLTKGFLASLLATATGGTAMALASNPNKETSNGEVPYFRTIASVPSDNNPMEVTLMPYTPIMSGSLMVSLNGQVLTEGGDFVLEGNKLTFINMNPSTLENSVIRFRGVH